MAIHGTPPTSYDCEIVQIIRATDGITVGTMRRRLPFVPTGDIELMGFIRGSVGRDDSERVKSITWDHEREAFVLFLAEDDAARDSGQTMDEAKRLYVDGFTWDDDPIPAGRAAAAAS